MKKKNWGYGDGSIGNVFASQAWDPESSPQNAHEIARSAAQSS